MADSRELGRKQELKANWLQQKE